MGKQLRKIQRHGEVRNLVPGHHVGHCNRCNRIRRFNQTRKPCPGCGVRGSIETKLEGE